MCTNLLPHGLCHRMWFADKEEMGKSIKFSTTKRSVSVYKLTDCMLCHRMWFADKEEMGKSIKFRQQPLQVSECVQTY